MSKHDNARKPRQHPDWDNPRLKPMQPFLNRGSFLQVKFDAHGRYYDTRPQYMMTDSDIEVIRSWLPNYKPENGFPGDIEAVLITKCGIAPKGCATMTIPQIVSCLKQGRSDSPPAKPHEKTLSQVAARLRDLPEAFAHCGGLEDMAGKLMVEAIALGAFRDNARLLNLVDAQRDEPVDVWLETVSCLAPQRDWRKDDNGKTVAPDLEGACAVVADLIETEAARAQEQEQEQPARHSPDFRSVHWYGTDYTFTATQAAVVEILWEAWENGTPNVSDARLLTKIETNQRRLADIFKKQGKPIAAWGAMIVKGETKGTRRLDTPIPPQKK